VCVCVWCVCVCVCVVCVLDLKRVRDLLLERAEGVPQQ
jgi:hypothetical protein